jgi:ATP-binding cassette, subfamily C, bacterial LapB
MNAGARPLPAAPIGRSSDPASSPALPPAVPWVLPRLLAALGWSGSVRAMIEALPHAVATADAPFDGNAIAGALRRLGRPARVWTAPLAKLAAPALPALWQLPDGRLGVITGRDGAALLVEMGPGEPPRRHDPARMRGTVLVFAGTDEATPGADRPLLFAFLAEHRAQLAGLLGLAVLGTIASIALGLVVMAAFDLVIPGGSLRALVALGVGFALALGFDLGLRAMLARAAASLGERAERRVLGAVLGKVLRLPLSATATQDPAAQLARMREVEAARDLLTGPAPLLLLQAPLVLLFLGAIWAIAGPLVLVPLALLPVQVGLALVLLPRAREAERYAARLAAERRRAMLETIAHAGTLRGLGCEAAWLGRFTDLSAGAAAAQRRAAMTGQAVQVLAQTGMPAAAAAIAALGALLVIDNRIGAGALVATIMLSWRVLLPMQQLILMGTRGRQIGESVAQLHRLEALRDEPRPPINAPPPQPVGHALRFDRVLFRFPGQVEPAIAGLSLAVPAGGFVAITGPSGAGKSTLLRLVLGLVQPQAGQVTLGGVNLAQFAPEALRARMGYVPQRAALVYGTLAQNLRLAAPTASVTELLGACQDAGILDQVERLPAGLETRLSDLDKEHLPESFRQGIALAQALLRRPDILLLDDPARWMDDAAERHLLALLDRVQGRVTVLMVTHRPSHIRRASLVVALERGQILQAAPPEQVPRLPRENLAREPIAATRPAGSA